MVKVSDADGNAGYKPAADHTEKGKLYECELFGTGCFAVHRSVFSKITKPYFLFKYDSEGMVSASEDLYFCEKVRNAGIPLFFDARYVCEHFIAYCAQKEAEGSRGSVSAVN